MAYFSWKNITEMYVSQYISVRYTAVKWIQCFSFKKIEKIPWRRKWQSTSVFLPEKSHGQRSLEDYSPWGCKRVRNDLVTKTVTKKTEEGIMFKWFTSPSSPQFLSPVKWDYLRRARNLAILWWTRRELKVKLIGMQGQRIHQAVHLWNRIISWGFHLAQWSSWTQTTHYNHLENF